MIVAGGGLRHRIDREVAAGEVLLERDVRGEARREAVVAGAGLPFGAGERVLFAGRGVQEDREVLAHGPVAEREQLVRRGADDDEVALDVRAPEQLVPHCAADEVDLHARMQSKPGAVGRRRAGSRCCVVALLCGCAPLSGCYLLQAAAGQAEVHGAQRADRAGDRRPGDAAGAPRAAAARAGGPRVRRARASACRTAAASASYADLGRDYAVWNVVATPELSVEPRRWCFPVAGCVAYRGYFDEGGAQRHGAPSRAAAATT